MSEVGGLGAHEDEPACSSMFIATVWHCLCHSRTTTFRVSGPSASRSTSAIATSPTSQHVTLSNMLSTWGHMCPCVCTCSFLRRTRDKFIIIGLTQYIARSACCERSRFESSTARATYQFIVCYRHFADSSPPPFTGREASEINRPR